MISQNILDNISVLEGRAEAYGIELIFNSHGRYNTTNTMGIFFDGTEITAKQILEDMDLNTDKWPMIINPAPNYQAPQLGAV